METEITADTRADRAVTAVTPLRAGVPIAARAAVLEETVAAVAGVGTVVAVAAGAAVRTVVEATVEGILVKRDESPVLTPIPASHGAAGVQASLLAVRMTESPRQDDVSISE